VIVASPLTDKSLDTVKSFLVMILLGNLTPIVPPLPKVMLEVVISISLAEPLAIRVVLPSTAVFAVEP